jgi:hypothetical protein
MHFEVHLLQNRRGHCQKNLETAAAHTGKDKDVDAQSTQHSRNHKFSNSELRCNVDEEDATFKKP